MTYTIFKNYANEFLRVLNTINKKYIMKVLSRRRMYRKINLRKGALR